MIFVLHYAQDAITNNCLQYLVGQGALIVIDNGSPEPFKPVYPVAVLRLPENYPLIRAFNEAMQRYPSDDYICVTNDTEPAPDMVSKLLAALDDPDVGIVAPGTNDKGAGVLYVSGPGEHPTQWANHVDNTTWAWRHDLVQKIGYPDCTGHTHRACWGANQDYCYRARKAGYKILAVRNAYTKHAHMGGQDMEAWQAGRDWLKQKWGAEVEKVWL